MKILKDVFSPEEITMLQEQVAAATPTPAAEPVKMAKELMTIDNKKLMVDGELVVGSKVMEVTEAGEVAAEGTFETSEGTIVVVAGLITEVKPKAEVEVPEVPMEMTTQLSAQKAEFEVKLSEQKSAFDKEIASLKETNKVLLTFMNKIIETPIETKETAPVKSFDEMSAFEKRNYLKSLEK